MGTDRHNALRRVLPLLLLALPWQPGGAQDRAFRYRDAPVRTVIADVEAATPYRFLYRDALVTGKTVTFEAPAGRVLAAFDQALRASGLALQVDEPRRQVLLTRVKTSDAAGEAPVRLTGIVVDAADGARLPFAAVTWAEDEKRAGVTASEAGVFELVLTGLPARDTLVLTASYVGYRPATVAVDLRRAPRELTLRLLPDQARGQEVVVTGTLLQSDLDTTWHGLIQPGRLAAFGEGSVLRSLQTLPSVSLSPALSPGMNVRGSRSDGFQVLLDGISIYNQTHLFGLFDAFNEEALQAVGFYYGITPAGYQGPPGGTLAFVTRTGSQAQPRFSAGLSNTAVRGTAEGPLFGGRGSWLVSARHSYLDRLGWFNNDALLALGLDVERRTSAPGLASRFDANLRTDAPDARFYDVHAKLYRESDDGQRWTTNVYLGGDETFQQAERLMQTTAGGLPPDDPAPVEEVAWRPVETRIAWGNGAFSVQEQRPLGGGGYSHLVLGFSRYHSRFEKDDFLYTQPVPQPAAPEVRARTTLGPFVNANTLTEVKLAQHVDVAPRAGGAWSAGYALHHYAVTYDEASIRRAAYAGVWKALQADLFGQYDTDPSRAVVVGAGLRSHFFGQGRFWKWSPRLQVRLFPQARVSASVGASRNYQFLHRLQLPHATSTDVWVTSTAAQPPASVDNVTGGVYVRALPSLSVQAEAYYKSYRNLRQHETSLPPARGAAESVLLNPWLHDNTARARGLEVLVRQRLGPLVWTNGYTLSRVEIRNPAVNDGRAFRADWDRTHQLTSYVEAALGPGLTACVLWAYATGTPNALAATDPAEPETLPAYHRLDLSLRYRRAFPGFTLEATGTAFNAYARDNTWYRSPVLVPDRDQQPSRLTSVTVDVYDLGFQPSFSVGLHF